MNSMLKTFVVVTTVALLSACSSTEKKDTAASVETPVTTPGDAPAEATTDKVDRLDEIKGIRFDQKDSPDYVRTIYFEYDSSEIRGEFVSLISAHAKLLTSDSSRKVILEGHADERGSREYNIALGERRAVAVRRLLSGGGVDASQMELISYGEERPAVTGHNESAWVKNRRVEIHYE